MKTNSIEEIKKGYNAGKIVFREFNYIVAKEGMDNLSSEFSQKYKHATLQIESNLSSKIGGMGYLILHPRDCIETVGRGLAIIVKHFSE